MVPDQDPFTTKLCATSSRRLVDLARYVRFDERTHLLSGKNILGVHYRLGVDKSSGPALDVILSIIEEAN